MTELEGRLPIFSGFYGTFFDPDYALDVDYMVRSRLESLLDRGDAGLRGISRRSSAGKLCSSATRIPIYNDIRML